MKKTSLFDRHNHKIFINDFINAISDRNEELLPHVDFEEGGQWFVDALVKYGVNEKGEKLRISKPLLDAARLIGDLRITTVSTSGGAQIFKTLIHLELVSALITIGKKDFAWVYPQANLIPKLVPTGFKPVIAAWENYFKLERKSKATDSKSIALHQSTYGTGRFISAANSAAASKEMSGIATANTNVVAFSSDLAIYEERSQYLQKNVDTIRRRFLQGRIPSYPERLIGTPGNGSGIELEISQADYSFISHIDCKGCGYPSTLSPLGALIVPIGDDNGRPIYFEPSGKPRDWWYKDESDKIGSAYFGCQHCGHEITYDDCMNSYFRCTKTGILLLDFLKSIPRGYQKKRISVGLILSPLIRDSKSSTAETIIRNGIQSSNTQDWQQQELGIPTSMSSGGITLDSIKRSIGAFVPKHQSDFYYFGLDQGRAEHWVVGIKYRLPLDTHGERPWTTIEKYERAHREVVLCKAITEQELDLIICKSHGGAIDNEPDRSWADKIARMYKGIILFDQVGSRSLNGLMHKPLIVQSGGNKIDAVGIDTHRFQNHILAFFNGTYDCGNDIIVPQVSLPSHIDSSDVSDKSLVRHLTSSSRDPDRGLWVRPEDKNDDLLKAFVGAELRFYLQIFGGKPSTYSGGIMDMNLESLDRVLRSPHR